MIIKSIELKNFRNYKELTLSLDCGTNIFYGDNAQGKTNILEAAYLSGTTKSHKCSKDKEMIRFGEQEAHIRTVVVKNDKEYQIDMHLKHNRTKGIAVNRMPIKNGPAERRRFLDAELCQLDKIYLSDLAVYNRILNQRNKLLKDMVYRPELADTLPVWDFQLAETGSRIIRRRRQFVEELSGIAKKIHAQLSGEREELLVTYEPSVREEQFEEELHRVRERDSRQCMTSIGPHRDDLLISIDGIDIRKFGSQGQQRTSALSLKLSEIELVKKAIHETPVLLLDDVLSELDSNRQNFLLSSIHDTQTLITCTGLDEFVKNRFEINRVFEVVKGTVKEQKE